MDQDKQGKKKVYEFLKDIDLFQGLSELDLERALKKIETISYSAGQMILEHGQTAKALYIVISGMVEGAYWDKYQLKEPIFTFEEKDLFCLISLLTNKPSQISFQALEETRVFSLPKASFLDLLTANPYFSQHIFLIMSERQAGLISKLLEIRHRQASLKTLMKDVEEETPFLVGKTTAMLGLWEKIPELANNPGVLLIKGEFGVGKELIGEILHSKGPLKNRPFIIIDAVDISERDWQERFWEEGVKGEQDEDGQYLVPISRTKFGFLELANGGTLMLKNVDALSPLLQKRLKDFLRAGLMAGKGNPMTPCRDKKYLPDVKMLLTTHIELEERVDKGAFDPELYKIIHTNVISLPPLRDRKVDILDLAEHFMAEQSARYKKKVDKLSTRAREQLLGYDYQLGNIQELDKIIERAVVLTATDTIRSEQLFLGPPAGRAHVWYNLLKIKAFDKMVRKGIYPGLFQWIAVGFFFFIMFSCFFGPQDPAKNWGTILVWWIWWPWLCLAAFWVGRTWCSFCAYATIGHSVQKRLNLRLRFPKFLKDYDYLIAIFIFLFIVWVEESSYMRYHPVYTGMLLASILFIEIMFSILFQRDIWCRHVCPMGNLIGVFAMTSIVEVRSNLDICANQCTTHECYNGTAELPGCPMFQHLLFVDNNQTCKLCLNCVRTCPYKAVSLNLRPPGWEIWESNQVRPGMAYFVWTLMAVIFPVMRPSGALFLTTLTFLAAPAIMIGLAWIVSYLGFNRIKQSAYEGFWMTTYAYVPLALAAHIAYQVRYLPWIKGLNYILLFNGKPLAGSSSIQYLIQVCFLLAGLLFSLYAIIRIAGNKSINEKAPNLIYWLGHIGIMFIYPFLIGYLLR